MTSFLMIATLLASGAPAVTAAEPIRMNVADREALVSGLRSRLGGRFILTGLDQADAQCRIARRCTTGGDLARAADATSTDLTRLVSSVDRAAGSAGPTVAIVSLRHAALNARGEIEMMASVYDVATQDWSVRQGLIGNRPVPVRRDPPPPGRRLIDWKDGTDRLAELRAEATAARD